MGSNYWRDSGEASGWKLWTCRQPRTLRNTGCALQLTSVCLPHPHTQIYIHTHTHTHTQTHFYFSFSWLEKRTVLSNTLLSSRAHLAPVILERGVKACSPAGQVSLFRRLFQVLMSERELRALMLWSVWMFTALSLRLWGSDLSVVLYLYLWRLNECLHTKYSLSAHLLNTLIIDRI